MPAACCCKLWDGGPLPRHVELHAIVDAQPCQPSRCTVVYLHESTGSAQAQQTVGCGRRAGAGVRPAS